MNAEHIKFYTADEQEFSIPNRWELLTPELYSFLMQQLRMYSSGIIAMEDVRVLYVYKSLGIEKMKDEDAIANIIVLSEHIDFIFDMDGRINSCFLAQLIPQVVVQGKVHHGYKVNTNFDTLTCTLTALQFIEAQEVLNSNSLKLPLLAAILYSPLPYSSEKAHELANDFANMEQVQLEAIALNFQSIVNFIFTNTDFSLLTAGSKKNIPEIAMGMMETLYNLSADGMGNVETVEQMPVIKFFTILRKKLIESIRAMHDAKMDLVKIEEKTGLPTTLIKKMI